MVRLGLIAIALAACNGEVLSDNLVGLSPQEQVAVEKWEAKAFPVFAVKCMMCHDGSMPDIGYLAGATDLKKRETLIAFMPAIVNLGAPKASRVINKGLHTGPALEINEASDILQWIVAEVAARPAVPPIRSMQLTPMLCTMGSPGTPSCQINTIDLSSLGVTGASFEVVVTQLSDSAYLTNMKFKAGAAGLYLEHPLLESWPSGATTPLADPIDRFFAVVLNLAAAAESPLGTGEATEQMWVATDPIGLRFDVIEMQRP